MHFIKLEKAMAPNSSTLAWKIPWTEKPGGLQWMQLRRVRHNWATSLSLFTFMHWRRKWQPTQCSCLENPRDGEAGGLLSMGSHRVGHDWSDLAAAVHVLGFPCGSAGKDHLQFGRPRFDPWVGKIPWRMERLPTPVFCPGKSHGIYIPRGHMSWTETQ